MADIKIAVIYFSATEVTHTYVRRIWERLQNQGCEVKAFNITAYSSRQDPPAIDGFNGIIFGFPVFSDFAPSVINEWLPTLDGRGKRSALFFTYGGRTTGYAHFHTKLLLEQAGFQVLFSAEFLGRHSFNVGGWRILPERPNAQDLALAEEYADLAIQRFSRDAPTLLKLQKPFGYNQVIASLATSQEITERHWKNPVRTADECSMCGNCEAECPTQAFDAHTGLSNPGRCIGCMHCVYICPEKVLKVDDMKSVYDPFLSNWNLTEEMMNAKQGKIITEPWQAAS